MQGMSYELRLPESHDSNATSSHGEHSEVNGRNTAAANDLLSLFEVPTPERTQPSRQVFDDTNVDRDGISEPERTSSGLLSLFDAPTPKRFSRKKDVDFQGEQLPLLSLFHSNGRPACDEKELRNQYDALGSASLKPIPLPIIDESKPVPSTSVAEALSTLSSHEAVVNGANNDIRRKEKSSFSHFFLDKAFPFFREEVSLVPQWLTAIGRACCQPTTYIGSFMFLLYHIVFCLTIGSAVIRPHAPSQPLLGLMTKQAACGVIFGCVNYWFTLSDIPALYPTVDLFSAPFLAEIAVVVDEALYQDRLKKPREFGAVSAHSDEAMFLATFAFLACAAILLSSAFIFTASVFVSYINLLCRSSCHGANLQF
jgi:hypothetical protein